MQRAFAPGQPELTASLECGDRPLPGQAGRQPARPVTLRQAQVDIGLAITPVFRLHPRAQVERHRLTIRQSHTRVQALTAAPGAQTEADVREGRRRLFVWLKGDLAVEQRQLCNRLHLGQQLFRVEGLIVLDRQTLKRPMAILVFFETQLQAIEFQVSDAHFTGQQAGPDVRHRPHIVQPQGTGALAHHHIVSQQCWGKTVPATFEAANTQRHIQRRAGLGFNFTTVLGHQGH